MISSLIQQVVRTIFPLLRAPEKRSEDETAAAELAPKKVPGSLCSRKESGKGAWLFFWGSDSPRRRPRFILLTRGQSRSEEIVLSLVTIATMMLLLSSGCSSLSQARRHPVTSGLKVKEVVLKPPQAEPMVGEKLTYAIRWIGIPVGTLTIEVKEKILFEQAEVYHLIGTVKSNGFLSKFYKIDDVYQSYWEAQNHSSRRFERKVAQGKYRAYEITTFYPDEKKGVYYAPLKDETKEFAISGSVQDVLSSIYYFRTVPYKMDLELLFPVAADEKNWQVGMKTVEQGILEIRNLGVHEAFLIEPSAILMDSPDPGHKDKKKSRHPRGKLWIWFGTDERRLPLVLRADTALVGEITVTLESIELAN